MMFTNKKTHMWSWFGWRWSRCPSSPPPPLQSSSTWSIGEYNTKTSESGERTRGFSVDTARTDGHVLLEFWEEVASLHLVEIIESDTQTDFYTLSKTRREAEQKVWPSSIQWSCIAIWTTLTQQHNVLKDHHEDSSTRHIFINRQSRPVPIPQRVDDTLTLRPPSGQRVCFRTRTYSLRRGHSRLQFTPFQISSEV